MSSLEGTIEELECQSTHESSPHRQRSYGQLHNNKRSYTLQEPLAKGGDETTCLSGYKPTQTGLQRKSVPC